MNLKVSLIYLKYVYNLNPFRHKHLLLIQIRVGFEHIKYLSHVELYPPMIDKVLMELVV